MQAVPQLSNIRQVSDGWIKKYVLAYTMPDGSTYEYESASRKSLEAYRAELEGNAAGRACAADAVCIVPQTATGELEFIEPFLLPIADVPRFLAENETPIGTRAQLVLEAFARRR